MTSYNTSRRRPPANSTSAANTTVPSGLAASTGKRNCTTRVTPAGSGSGSDWRASSQVPVSEARSSACVEKGRVPPVIVWYTAASEVVGASTAPRDTPSTRVPGAVPSTISRAKAIRRSVVPSCISKADRPDRSPAAAA